jgi:hypothetical protein
MYAIASRFITAGGHNSAATHAANDQGLALEAAIPKTFYRDKEGIQVQVKDCPIVHRSNIGHFLTVFTSNNEKGSDKRFRAG